MKPIAVRTDLRGRALIVTIESGPVNVINRAVRAGLLEAAEEAEERLSKREIERVVFTGAGRTFAAGADAKEFDAPPLEPHLPDVILRLMTLPAVAAINGAALGGGFEIALACRARVASPKALLGLPETTLGVVPGSGGTQRLPRLIGIAKAVPLIAEGRTVGSAQGLELGIVDEVAEDVVAAALALDAALLARPPVDELPAPAAAPEAIAAARANARNKLRGQVAPLKAIELVEATASVSLIEGLAAEREAFLTLRRGEQARALRHVFFAERDAGRSGALATLTPASIETALVAGGGTMGAAIAYALNSTGIRVTILETNAEAEERARANVGQLFDEAVKRGKLAQEEATRRLTEALTFVSGAETDLPPVDIAIEAVFEDLKVKRALFTRFSKQLPETTILATNTSYLDPNAIAEGIDAPRRFLGLHFFAPAHIMKLVEVVRAASTSQQTLATVFGLTKRLGKIAVEAGICDGFIGNRVLTRYRHEADTLLLDGALPWEIDAALTDFGMAMGVYATQDLSGLDIAYFNRQRKDLRNQPGIRYIPLGDRMVEDLKRLGRKTQAGWYDYRNGKPVPSNDVKTLIEASSAEAGITRRQISSGEIVRRLMLAQVSEALGILEEGIARDPADVDLVMVHGYGFPRWRGGPMRLADEWGLSAIQADIAALAVSDPLSWKRSALLDRLVAEKASASRGLASVGGPGR